MLLHVMSYFLCFASEEAEAQRDEGHVQGHAASPDLGCEPLPPLQEVFLESKPALSSL